MEADIVKQFSQELASLYEAKPPVSKAKMVQITKGAIKGIKYYKHIVMAVEKFIHRCKPEYKLPGLYVIDSIVRQSRHQFGADKDLFAPRFGKNIVSTFQSLNQCADDDKPKVLRVLNLWLQNGVFTEDCLQPVVELAANFVIGDNDAEDGGKEILSSEKPKRQTGGSPRLTQDNRHEIKNSTTPPLETRPRQHSSDVRTTPARGTTTNAGDNSNLDPGFLQQIQKLTSSLITQHKNAQDSERRLTKKILADYDYSDEESGEEDASEKGGVQSKEGQKDDMTANLAAAAQNLLNNPQLLQQIQQIQQSIRNPTSVAAPPQMQIHSMPPRMPMSTPIPPVPTSVPPFGGAHRFPTNFSMPPPNYSVPPPMVEQHPQPPVVARQIDSQAMNYPPPAEPLPPGFDSNRHSSDTDDRRRQRGLESGSKRRKSRDRSRTRSPRSRSREKKRKRKSRSRSGSRGRHRRNRSRSIERRNREKERERERRGLPPLKTRHVSICSRTLWFGRVPPYCEQDEIKQAVKEYGEPVSIDLIPPRGCAYIVMPDRKSAFKVLDRLKDLKIQNRTIKMAWAPGKGVKKAYEEEWDVENGVTYIAYEKMPNDLTPFVDGGTLDLDSLPENLRQLYDESGKIGATSSQAIPIPPTGQPPPPAMIGHIPYPHYPGMPSVYPSAMTQYPPPVAPGSQQGHMHPPPMTGSSMVQPPPHNAAHSQMGLPAPSGNAMVPVMQQPTFGVRVPTAMISGGHSIPSLMSSTSNAHEQQRYPYPPPGRGRGGVTSPGNFRGRGGRGGYGGPRPSWGGQHHGDESSSMDQQQHHSHYERNERNFRGRGGFGGQRGGSGYSPRGGQQSRFHYDTTQRGHYDPTPTTDDNMHEDTPPEERTGQDNNSRDTTMETVASEETQNGSSKRRSRWGSASYSTELANETTTNNLSNVVLERGKIAVFEDVEFGKTENVFDKMKNFDANEKVVQNTDERPPPPTVVEEPPEPGSPPTTVVEEREVGEESDRYDQRGLGMLLKMMKE